MIAKTTGLVLRHVPVTESSRAVTWLTPDRGRMGTLIRGASRPKSFFLGQFDLFYTCEIVFYERRAEGLHLARECAPLALRPRFRSDWRACATASYLAHLALAASLRDSPQPELYGLVTSALDTLAEEGADPHTLAWIELRFLRVLGLAPRLDACVACSRRLDEDLRGATLPPGAGGLLCPSCSRDTSTAHAVSAAALGALRAWQNAPSPRIPRRTRLSRSVSQQLLALLGAFLTHHLECSPRPRELALQALLRSLRPARTSASAG